MSGMDVLVCTRNRPQRAATVVRDVLDQGVDVQVIVVDQSDEPAASTLRASLPAGVQYRRTPPLGLPRARNVALDLAAAPVVLYLDDDVRLLPGCLAAHRHAYTDPQIGAAVGRLIEKHAVGNARRTNNRVNWHGRVVTQLAGIHSSDVHVTKGANMSFRREVLVRTGGFDARLTGTALLEDAEASARVADQGYRIRFLADAEVVHLSDPAGGVRQDSSLRTLSSRLHNTALFVASRRGALSMIPTVAVFSAIAMRRAMRSASIRDAATLARAFLDGVSDAKKLRDGYVRGDATRYACTQ